MKKTICCFLVFLSIIAFFQPTTTQAQTITDVLRYSQTTFGGTARNMGVAGAFGALGADFSAASNNPAGLGLYSKGEVVFTPALQLSSANATYFGTESSDNHTNFHLSNASVVFPNSSRRRGRRYNPRQRQRQQEVKPKAWRGVNFAVGFNRVQNFNGNQVVRGFNTQNSLTSFYAEQANGIAETDLFNSAQPFSGTLAYNTFLINPDVNNALANQYVGVAQAGGILQEISTTTRRSMNEGILGLGANYKDKLYIGASLGLPFLNYESETVFTESDENNQLATSDLQSLRLEERLNADGTGINVKLGLIYRFSKIFRGGFSFHTPTFFTIDEQFSSELSSNFDNGDAYSDVSPSGIFNYNITTPMRFVLSGAAVIPKLGFISIDYELVNYKQASVSFNDATAEDRRYAEQLNQQVDDTYTVGSNLRIGGEFAKDALRLRAGYALYTSPFQDGNGGTLHNLTAGLGLRGKSIYGDLAFVRTMGKVFDQAYTLSSEPVESAEVKTAANRIALSVGFRF